MTDKIKELQDEIISLKQFSEGLMLACDRLRTEKTTLKNSLADEIALNLNLTQTNQLLEIMRHKQDKKINEIIELFNRWTEGNINPIVFYDELKEILEELEKKK